jgi:hypothetical protein
MPFSTYIHGRRQGHATKTLQPIIKRLAKLTTSPTFDANDLVGAEVRATDSRGVERLYAVLTQDPKTGVLHLKDVEGHDTIISH